MFCRKCGKENPNDAKFCASCGTDLHPAQPMAVQPNMQQPQPVYAQYPNTAVAVQQKSKNKTVIIVIAALAVLGLIVYFVCNQVNNSNPLYGTWYVKLSQMTGSPVTVNFTQNEITFSAGAVGNSDSFTVKYDKVDNNTLKIYPLNGDKPFNCHYEMNDDNLYLSCSSESSLNLVLTKGEIKVPVNN